jgi:hypothetical protein
MVKGREGRVLIWMLTWALVLSRERTRAWEVGKRYAE